ncbi:MAG: DUF4435 domain-containing protein [Algicola sp.]|nr:DUF4435 domain-containing protein [Algicola sp.]
MSNIDSIISAIEEKELGETQKRVLIVEGDSDVVAFESFLGKHNADWEDYWVVCPAGKKSNVIKVLKKRLQWIGVVDADEWLSETIAEKQAEVGNLWVLPRFCIENTLIVATELWQSLSLAMQNKISGGFDEMANRINRDLEQWVKHGVLWSVINPLQDGIQKLGFKDALLDFRVAQDEAAIRQKLQQWHDYINPDVLLNNYHTKLAEVQALSETQQLKHWVHGKQFFRQVVNPVINGLLDMRIGSEDFRESRKMLIFLFNQCPVPDDFDSLWEKMALA